MSNTPKESFTLSPAERVGFLQAIANKNAATRHLAECVDGILELRDYPPDASLEILDLEKCVLSILLPDPSPSPDNVEVPKVPVLLKS